MVAIRKFATNGFPTDHNKIEGLDWLIETGIFQKPFRFEISNRDHTITVHFGKK